MSTETLVIRFEPRAEALQDLLDRLEDHAETIKLPTKIAYRVAVVCEELAANVVMHGSAGDGGATYVEVRVSRETDRVRLVVEDDGRPFDPLARADPDTSLDVENRNIGGLGVHFVKRLAEDMTYERRDGVNCLTVVFDMVE